VYLNIYSDINLYSNYKLFQFDTPVKRFGDNLPGKGRGRQEINLSRGGFTIESNPDLNPKPTNKSPALAENLNLLDSQARSLPQPKTKPL
jgi:hypothetical protein